MVFHERSALARLELLLEGLPCVVQQLDLEIDAVDLFRVYLGSGTREGVVSLISLSLLLGVGRDLHLATT